MLIQGEIKQEALKELILIKNDGEHAYNEGLREILRLLNTYKYDQKELKIIMAEIEMLLPLWRKKQLLKEGEF